MKSSRRSKKRGNRSTQKSKSRIATTDLSVFPTSSVSNTKASGVGSLPGAYTKVQTAHMGLAPTPDGVEVWGRDLVSPIPQTVAVAFQQNLFAVIPANPCYWKGTRIASLAAAYQCYRPLELVLHYVPQVAVTTAGTVLCGTIWNTPIATESLEQAMVTSNGGAMSQCYNPFKTEIKLGSNLQQNLFTCAGSLDEDHNPFFFVAMMRGNDVVPGYFFVEYRYALKNPLGQAVAYDMLFTRAPEYGAVRIDRSLLTLGPVPGLAGPGLVLDLESDAECYYNDTLIEIPDGTPVVVFANNPMTVVDNSFSNAVQSVIILPDEATVGSSINLYPDRAMWNWETDANYATGHFARSGSTPVSFRSTLDSLAYWIENAAAGITLFVYTLELATNTIGPLISMVRALNGSASNPTGMLGIAPRMTVTHRRSRVVRTKAAPQKGLPSSPAASTSKEVDKPGWA